MEKLDGLSLDLEKQNINKLKELFPIAVEEGKINFDLLRAILGDEVDDSKEKYQFTWKGKSESIKLAQTPSAATLRPCKDKSKDWDSTDNLYIEGDNLEVLKQLQKTYYGKIKMIYIDPPYNTGKDFVYKDNFSSSFEGYITQTQQKSKSNPEINGRYHTDWLNMMYPRLLLSKNLLNESGLIFISIDDNEQENLKKICNEIFGESNFVAQVVWERSYAPINMVKHFSKSHDYILVYAKDIYQAKCNGLPRKKETNAKYSNPDNDPRGLWRTDNMSVGPVVESKVYEIITPSGRKCLPPKGRCWLYTKERYLEMVADNRIWFGDEGNNVPAPKRFLSEVKQGMTPMTIWKYEDVGHTQDAMRELRDLFGGEKVFDYSKPIKLMKQIISLYCNENDIIIDFFSGSASTAHATMQLNAEDGGRRQFIMVQLPELCDEKKEAYKAGYKNICEIGEERIRLAGEQIKKQWKEEHPGEEFNTDIGFKVFELDSTNIIPWDDTAQYNESNLFELSEVFKKDRTKEDILYEIMLKYGIFDKKVEQIDVNGKTMFRIGRRYMVVCLEDNVNSEDVKAIGELGPRVVVFKEDGFINDNAKINATYNLEKYGVEDIKYI
ncbi:site-specific DNA-methyltransferase [Catenibacterium mitsuokai]|uniref:site-specific DNA-methyltransferase n=1 Tax=Catenibacterium mitsuokai TaxID=100886 RepID=UPI003D0628EC